jgi:hypothetical protein
LDSSIYLNEEWRKLRDMQLYLRLQTYLDINKPEKDGLHNTHRGLLLAKRDQTDHKCSMENLGRSLQTTSAKLTVTDERTNSQEIELLLPNACNFPLFETGVRHTEHSRSEIK